MSAVVSLWVESNTTQIGPETDIAPASSLPDAISEPKAKEKREIDPCFLALVC
jgi:hypothetical protein